MDIAAAGVAYGGYKAIDGLSGKRISKAQDAIKHKVKGDVKVGNDWYSKQDIPVLEESGIIKKDKDGQYHYEEGKSAKEGRTVVQESLSRPTVSAGAFQTPQTNNTTSVPTNTAAASANMDNSSNINSPEGKNTPFDVSKYNNT